MKSVIRKLSTVARACAGFTNCTVACDAYTRALAMAPNAVM